MAEAQQLRDIADLNGWKQTSNCKCKSTDYVVRFGDGILCLQPNCLAGWLWVNSGKMGAARFRLRLIRRRGRDIWYDFCQYFAGWCWEHLVKFNHQGISVFSIADAALSYLTGKSHDDHYIDSVSLTIHEPWDDSFDYDDEGELIEHEGSCLASSDNPFANVLANRVMEQIADPIVCLFIADQITLADAAMLLGMSVANTQEHISLRLSEAKVQSNAHE